MKKGFVLVLILFFTSRLFANHLLGGELGYTYLGATNDTQHYRVRLSFLADCSSASITQAFAALYGADPLVKLYNGSTLVTSLRLTMNDSLSDVDITPVCPDEAENTTCVNVSNPIPGIKRYVYDGVFDINSTSANWKFTFEGDVSTAPVTAAGRSTIIGNANVLGGSSIMYLTATLNNTLGANSSPTFTSLPSPFFCVNKQQNYSLGAVDPDGDMMTYGLSPALQLVQPNIGQPANIAYISPYNATNPIPADAGNFSFNGTNGQMTFTPSTALNCLVVNSVNEYRNGTLVGTSMREMVFVILDNCNNDPPTGEGSDGQNVIISEDNGQQTFQFCQGQAGVVSFDINSTDPNGDNVTVTWNNLPNGANMSVDNNGTPNTTMHFNWNPNNVSAGNYTFYVTYTDDGCPLASTQTIAYTIQVLGPDSVVQHLKTCTDDMPYMWNGQTITQGGDSVAVFTTTSAITGCDSTSILSLEINNDTATTDSIGVCPGDMPYTWNGQIITAPGNGIATYHTTSVLTGCDSVVTLNLWVNPLPVVTMNIIDPPENGFCIFDSVSIMGAGARSYTWYNTNGRELGIGDSIRTILPESANTITVIGVDSNGCKNSDSVNIPAGPCCTLLMPNAFTPNNDGHNDNFGPVTDGHPVNYQFQVFNRWGQRVFVSFKVENKWDGVIDGKPAPTDVYFYRVTGNCITGERIDKKGEFTLVR